MTSKKYSIHDHLHLIMAMLVALSSVIGRVGGFQSLPGFQRLPQSNGFSTIPKRFSPCHVVKDETGTLSSTGAQEREKYHHVSIEYCTGCRWMLKSFWLAQELLSTFGKSELDAVTVRPSFDKQGKFLICLSKIGDNLSTTQPTEQKLLWDRQERGGFPAPKDLKQMVRDFINPDMYLGHSDTKSRQNDHEGKIIDIPDRETALPQEAAADTTTIQGLLNPNFTPSPSITIHYCTGCQWLLRAAYFGQELLTTFGSGEIKSVTLVPSRPPEKGGRFSIELDGEELFDRKTEGRFPEPKEIKQMIRDRIAPSKDLGHSDVDGEKVSTSDEEGDINEDDAADARKYFGVM